MPPLQLVDSTRTDVARNVGMVVAVAPADGTWLALLVPTAAVDPLVPVAGFGVGGGVAGGGLGCPLGAPVVPVAAVVSGCSSTPRISTC